MSKIFFLKKLDFMADFAEVYVTIIRGCVAISFVVATILPTIASKI
jgi:hypothetical protein